MKSKDFVKRGIMQFRMVFNRVVRNKEFLYDLE